MVNERRERSEPSFGTADLHIHTAASDGLPSVEALLAYVEEHTSLDVIAITDHDGVAGALAARELAARRGYRFEVVVGTEVTTREGHLLALFVERPLRRHQSLEETVEAIHRQGGLCVVPHPLSWLVHGVQERALDRLFQGPPEVRPDAIELTRANFMAAMTEARARALNAARYHMAETGGSDAHFLTMVGCGLTRFPGRTADDLRRAIVERTTSAVTQAQFRLRDLPLSEVLRQQWHSVVVRRLRRALRGSRLLRGRLFPGTTR